MSSAVIVVTGAGPSPDTRGMRDPSTTTSPSGAVSSAAAGRLCSLVIVCADAIPGSAQALAPASAIAITLLVRII